MGKADGLLSMTPAQLRDGNDSARTVGVPLGAPRDEGARQVDLRLLAQRFAVLFGGHAGAKGAALVAAVLLGRSLGPQALGVFTALVTVLSFGTVAINSGLDNVGTREIARSSTRARDLVRWITAYRLGGAVVVAGAAHALGPLLHVPGREIAPFALAVCAFAFRSDWALIGLGRVGAVSAGQVLREVCFLGAVVAIVVPVPSVISAGYAFLIAEVIWSIFLSTRFWRMNVGSGDPGQQSFGWLLREAAPMLLLSAMALTYNKVDGPLLILLRGSQEAGVYAAAYTIFMAACAPGAILGRVALPELAKSRVTGSAAGPTHGTFRRIVGSSFLVGALCGTLVAIFAKPIMHTLYGLKFSGGVEPLRYLVAAVPLHFGFSVLVQALLVDGQRRALVTAGLAGVVVNVGANLALIPQLGMTGAAIATFLSEAAALIAAVVTARPTTLDLGWFKGEATAR